MEEYGVGFNLSIISNLNEYSYKLKMLTRAYECNFLIKKREIGEKKKRGGGRKSCHVRVKE